MAGVLLGAVRGWSQSPLLRQPLSARRAPARPNAGAMRRPLRARSGPTCAGAIIALGYATPHVSQHSYAPQLRTAGDGRGDTRGCAAVRPQGKWLDEALA